MIILKTWNIITIIVSLLTIVLINPIGDAVRDRGNKRLQKRLELLRDVATWTILFAVTEALTFVVCGSLSHLFFRIAFHNLAYNFTAGKPWYFTGTTSTSDLIESKMDKIEVLIARIVSLAMAIFLLFKAIQHF